MYIPRGPVLRRHVAGLLPYANQVVAIRTTGHRIKMWLEHAALIFNTLHTDAPHQMLTNECIPAFQFDTIFGLQYQIDPSSPPFERISEIQFEGAPVRPTQDFMLATTQFRAAGGGGYTPTPPAQVVTSGYHALHDALVDVLDTATRDPWEDRPAWRFAPLDCVEAVLLTHPDAIGHLRDISHLLPMPLGTTSDGFIQLRITL